MYWISPYAKGLILSIDYIDINVLPLEDLNKEVINGLEENE